MRIAVATGEIPVEQLERFRRELTGYCSGCSDRSTKPKTPSRTRCSRLAGAGEVRGPGRLRPWLYRIATNVCIDMLKGRSRRELPRDVAPVATGELPRGDARPEAYWISRHPTT